MKYLRPILIFSFFVSFYSGSAYALDFGTPEKARAMLEQAVVALRANKSEALEAFNNEEGGYRDRDLYVFCGGPDGNFTAHPRAVGYSLKEFVDHAGNPVGEQIYRVAREGKFSDVTYLTVRRGEPGPRRKTSLITMVDDQVCGVGYFDPDEPAPTADTLISGYQGVFIYGYDPVAYFTMDEPVKGLAEFAYQHLGGEWHFVSDEHRQMFIVESAKYIPQHGGYCSSAATGGHAEAANPRAWSIIDGRLYLFASNRRKDGYVPDTTADADWQQKLMEIVSQ